MCADVKSVFEIMKNNPKYLDAADVVRDGCKPASSSRISQRVLNTLTRSVGRAQTVTNDALVLRVHQGCQNDHYWGKSSCLIYLSLGRSHQPFPPVSLLTPPPFLINQCMTG